MSVPSASLKIGRAILSRALLGAALIGVLLLLSALMFSGFYEPAAIVREAEAIAALEKLKDQAIQADQPLQLQVDVDYSVGEQAAWFPKEEAPILKELVEKGALPPVEERAGKEPLVMRSVDGPGNYGGTMFKLNHIGGWRMTPTALVRWSPQGYPIVPNLAKSYTANEDYTEFTFQLREGVKWSDGQPFTSEDIVYWWEAEQNDRLVTPGGPWPWFIHSGEPMKVEALGPYTVRFSFSAPYALFVERLAGYPAIAESPRHFLEKFHPVRGDKELIRRVMKTHSLINERAVYGFARNRVEKPLMAPWVMRTERTTPPITYVRNPYFWAVDEQGRQLPYLDRIVQNEKSEDMLTIAAAQGEVSMQARYIRTADYVMLMNQREQYGYEVHHWINGDGADWGLSFNLNRRFEDGEVEAKQKARLLSEKRFRQALSLAVDRAAIVEALYAGMGSPSQIAPPELSPFSYEDFVDPFAQFDPEKANRLLDEIGLTDRDASGYRKFPDGPPLLFDVSYTSFTGEGPGQFIVDDWRRVGINARLRPQERGIFYVEKAAGLHDMSVWGAYGAFLPIIDPRYYLPFSDESNFAVRYGQWYAAGGMFREDQEMVPGQRPPADSPLFEAMEIYEEVKATPVPEERRELFRRILELASENVYLLTITSPLPQLAIVQEDFENVPMRAIHSWDFLSPSNMYPETWFWKDPTMSPQAVAGTQEEISTVTPQRPLVGGSAPVQADVEIAASSQGSRLPGILASLIKWGIGIALVLLLLLAMFRSPYVTQRVLMMIPMLLIIAVVSFIVIELPAGDAVTSIIVEMKEKGGVVDQAQIDDIRNTFRVDEPAWKRFTWWFGLDWFLTFEPEDKGLLQGNMGRSMLSFNPVNDMIGDRLLFTFLLSLGTIIFTWIVALPIGIYSAVKQYSFFDYVFTIGGFIGMCIPGFLLALLLMFAAEAMFGLNVSGLFSPEYAAMPGWTTGKVLDLLKHLWLPILVMGVTGTAGMIRVMRANLLDELKRPYVTTARAKGVRPLRLLFKYPVRLALNPFISGIGGILPELISGGAIVAIVMSLPTIGPLQLQSVMQQDMYLAGSLLMLLSLLSVIGTLLSDLLLAVVDPRIRFEGGSK